MFTFKKLIAVVFCLLLTVCFFTACEKAAPEYTITYDANGGTISTPTQIVSMNSEFSLATPEREGYTFNGWFIGDTKCENGLWTEAADVTLIAEWTANTYNLSYDTDGGNELADQEVTYDAAYQLATPEKNGYTFDGWYKDETKYDGTKWTDTANVTLKAKWVPIVYEITYENNGGTHSNVESYTIEDTFTLIPPTKTGYTFLGWTYNGLSSPILNLTIEKGTFGNKIFTANWGVNVYKITYDANGGSVSSDTQMVDYDTYFYLATPKREGYTFDGWYKEETKYESGKWTEMTDIVLKAKWTANKYTIKFDTYADSTIDPLTVTYDADYTLPTPEKTGYTFDGWYHEGIKIEDGKWLKAYDLRVNARWNAIEYSIKYNLDGGTHSNPETYNIESSFLLKEPSKTGYSFVGWTYDGQTTPNPTVLIDSSIGNKEFTANWSINSYHVITEANPYHAGEVVGAGEYEYNSTVTLTAKTKRLGYEFIGWYKGETLLSTDTTYSFTLGASNTRIAGKWDIKDDIADFRFESSATYCTITGLIDESKTTIVIPDYVTGIGDYALGNYYNIKSITLPKNLTSIGAGAFCGCDITSITIPASVTSIGKYAFYECTELTSITIPESATILGKGIFVGCKNLTGVTLPSSITSISEGMFEASGLTNITIPDGVTSIEKNAFRDCTALKSLNIPNGVTTIGNSAFSGCIGITSITIPESVTNFGDSAFYGCINIKTAILPAHALLKIQRTALVSITITSGTKIPDNAFNSCYDLTNIVIPESIASIGAHAFQDCISLTDFKIPEAVTTIKTYSFKGCKKLTSITIPKNVSSIESSAFSGCNKLIEVINLSDLPIFAGSETFGSVAYNAKEVHEGTSKVANVDGFLFYTYDGVNYLLGYLGKDTEITLPARYNGQKYEIHPYAFYKSDLKKVTLSDGATTIGNYAFGYCEELTSVTIPGSVTSIGAGAFRDCTSLTSITIPNSVTSIGENAFRTCTSLQSITLPSAITAINSNTFYECKSLTDVAIPSGVTKISDSAFYGCEKLANVTIPSSVKTIYAYAFKNCKAITSITIPEGVEKIGTEAFMYCTSLSSITLPESITSIGESAFYDTLYYNTKSNWVNEILYIGKYLIQASESIENCIVKPDTKLVASYAFHNCRNIRTATLPIAVLSEFPKTLLTSVVINGGTTIKEQAFNYCINLTSVTIGDSITTIDRYAFANCSALTKIIIGENVTNVSEYAFYNCKSLSVITVQSANSKYHSAGNCLIDTANKTLVIGCNNSTIPNDGSVTVIGPNAFYYCTYLTSLTIPNTVTKISDYAFCGCSGITSITIPSSVTSMGYNSFYNCTKIETAALPVTAIDKIPKDSLKTVIINGGTIIPQEAFYNCDKLTSVTIGNTITSIGNKAFSGCDNIESITVQSGNSKYHTAGNCLIETGSKKVIFGCKNSTIPTDGSVTSIGYYAFSSCTELVSITIPNYVTSLDEGAFSYCSGLTSITFTGTASEWATVNKGPYSLFRVPAENVVCSDGTAPLF